MQSSSAPPPPPYEDRPSAPPGWIVHWSDQYRGWYYINTTTHVSQWEPPTGPPQPEEPAVEDDAALAARLQAEEDELARTQDRQQRPPQQYGDYLQPGPAAVQRPYSSGSPSPGPSPGGSSSANMYGGGYSPPQPPYGQNPGTGAYNQYSQDTNFYGQPQPQGPGNTKPGGLLGRLMSKVQGRMSQPSGTMSSSTAAAGVPPPPPTGMTTTASGGGGGGRRPNKWGGAGVPIAAGVGGAGAGLLGGFALDSLLHSGRHSYGHSGYYPYGGGFYGGPPIMGPGYYDEGPSGMLGGPVGVYSGMPGFYGGGYCSDGGFYGRDGYSSSGNSRRSSMDGNNNNNDNGGDWGDGGNDWGGGDDGGGF